MGESVSALEGSLGPGQDTAHEEAVQERVYAAERRINYVRAAVIVFNSLVYVAFLRGPPSIDWLAWTVIGVANSYWIVVAATKPYRSIEVIHSSYFTSVSDAILITAWILATGAYGSPFYVLWYVSIVAIAFRYGFRTSVVVSGFYAACYAALLAGTGELLANGVDVAVRSSYIFLVGSLGGLVSLEAHKQTEEKVRMRRLMEQARNAESRFRRLIESAPDAILISDPSRKVQITNTQAEHLFGMPREEIVGAKLEDLVPGLIDELGSEPSRRPAGGADPPTQPIEGRARRKDGGEVPVEASVAPLETRGGTLLSCIVRDVSDRKAAERELEARNRELARSNHELQQFAYVASHDLQEPLRMVSSYVQLLERRYGDELDEDASEFIGYATEGVERMRGLINDLLAFSQVGALDRAYDPVDLEEVAQHVVGTLSEALDEDGIEVHVGELPTVVADPSQMQQLFQNLVSNAAKFRQEKDPKIWIEAERDGADWLISVRDNGIGIEEEYQEKIFVIFQRLHDRAEYPGTGIGLAICRKIVEGHGGRIWVESPPERAGIERGAEFRFTIPVLRTGSTPPDGDGQVGDETDGPDPDGGPALRAGRGSPSFDTSGGARPVSSVPGCNRPR